MNNKNFQRDRMIDELERTERMVDERLARCPGCGKMIDPDWCWCGEHVDNHTLGSGHMPVPVGCECMKGT